MVNSAYSGRAWIATPHLGPDHRGPVGRAFVPMPGPETIGPAVARLAAVAAGHPQATAIVETSGTTDFAALVAAVARIAAALPAGNAPVAILLPTSAAYVAAVFACLAARRLAVMLDASYPPARNAQIAGAAGIAVVLSDAATAATLDWPGVAVMIVDPLMGPGAAPPLPALVPDLDAPAFILTTSGSTGSPKLIVHSERTMLHWVRSTHNAIHVTPADRVLSLSSLSSLGGFTALLSYPLAGASMQLLDLGVSGIAGLLAVLREGRVTLLRGAPSLLRGLAKLPDAAAALAHLRVAQTYGEPLLKADVPALRAVLPPDCLIRTTYGSTEASGLSWFVREDDAQDPLRVPGGVLMPDTEAAVVDEDGGDCGRGQAGELVIRSRYNALGEWQDGALLPGRLAADPDDPAYRIYATGDLTRCDEDGVFVILGRRDRMLNLNGVRIEPAEIEHALAALPGVDRAEVVVDERNGRASLVAFVATAAEADLADFKARLRAQLPAIMVPARLIGLREMPLLPGGKVDTQALRRLAAA